MHFSSLKISKFDVGNFIFLAKFFVKVFDPSNCELILSGPKTLIFVFLKYSTIPSTKGFSGPTIINSIFFSSQVLWIFF